MTEGENAMICTKSDMFELRNRDLYAKICENFKLIRGHDRAMFLKSFTYRIYSRISRGFLDNFLIMNWLGRRIKA